MPTMRLFGRSFARCDVLAIVVAVAAVVALARSGPQPPEQRGAWQYLSDLPWVSASAGRASPTQASEPRRNADILGRPIRIGGVTYAQGIGAFPRSEIEYQLDGGYVLFRAIVGVSDRNPRFGSAIFRAYADDVLVFDSGVVRPQDGGRPIEFAVVAIETLRLVVEDGGDGTRGDLAIWADAKLLETKESISIRQRRLAQHLAEETRHARAEAMSADTAQWEAKATAEFKRLEAALGRRLETIGAKVMTASDDGGRTLYLANDKLAVGLGFDGQRHGYITVLAIGADGSRRLVVDEGVGSVTIRDAAHNLRADSDAMAFRFVAEEAPSLGLGLALEADFGLPDESTIVTVKLAMYDGMPYFTYQFLFRRLDRAAAIGDISYFDSSTTTVFGNANATALTDDSRLIQRTLRDDGRTSDIRVGAGKPLFIGDASRGAGVLTAIIDETSLASTASLGRLPTKVVVKMGFSHCDPKTMTRTERGWASHRLLVQPGVGPSLQRAFAEYRRLTTELYPAAPIPEWVRHQWLSWYVYYMELTEEALVSQIDYIAANLRDVGPWHILIDAGWYIADGHPDGDFRNVATAKFPSGLRWLVDYAHAKGLKVVLYISLPYIDTRSTGDNWVGLTGVIRQHPDWLIAYDSNPDIEGYILDFDKPEVNAYVSDVIRDFFEKYDVDGIKLDGLGMAEGSLLTVNTIEDGWGDPPPRVAQTLDIYRAVYESASRYRQNPYIESCWDTPTFANPYAQTFRFGDEMASFDAAYPSPGLSRHIEYAVWQIMALGQRPNMGALRSEDSQVSYWWLEASLALGTQVALSLDLQALTPEALSKYRQRLIHYAPFEVEPRLSSLIGPTSFATTVGELTYIGVINRATTPATRILTLSSYGLDANATYTVYDVEQAKPIATVRRTLGVAIPGESFRLYVLRKTPGVLWTNSSYETTAGAAGLTIIVEGPPIINGFIHVATAEPAAVLLDDQPIPEAQPRDVRLPRYTYDAAAAVATVYYDHTAPHTIELTVRR